MEDNRLTELEEDAHWDPFGLPEPEEAVLMGFLMADPPTDDGLHLCPLCNTPLEDPLEECPGCAAEEG